MVTIAYGDEALKQLKHIGAAELKKVRRKLTNLKENPLSGKKLEGELSHLRCFRAWPLRILYTFDPDSQTIVIETIGYRGQVYK
jgi:mRNA-degrading endonuclease RelE of RelBE toxin-antitoxin system